MDDSHWNPGGWAAKKKGCTCPRLDNREGEGRLSEPFYMAHQYIELQGDKFFVINLDCSLHADVARYSPTRGSNGS